MRLGFERGLDALDEQAKEAIFVRLGEVDDLARGHAGVAREGVGHGEPREGRTHVDDAIAEPHDAAREARHELLGVADHVAGRRAPGRARAA